MSRLPVPGSDDDIWGNILNDFLSVELNGDGTLKRAADIADAKTAADSAESQITNLTGELAAKYSLPAGGIPTTDLSSSVQTQLTAAGSAYQKPAGGIPESDMSSAVQTKLDAVTTSGFIRGDGIAQVTVGSTAPTNPNIGDVWIAA